MRNISSGSPVVSLADQRGAVLFVSLVMLLLVTIIGISGMQLVTLEEKMVSNMQNLTLAYHGAEAGLATCEAAVQSSGGNRGNAVVDFGELDVSWHRDETVWERRGVVVDYTGLPEEPRCVPEFIGTGTADKDMDDATYQSETAMARPVYRVTSRSRGGDARSEVILESLFICPGGCIEL